MHQTARPPSEPLITSLQNHSIPKCIEEVYDKPVKLGHRETCGDSCKYLNVPGMKDKARLAG